MSRPVPPELTTFLAPFPSDVREVALGLRSRVLAVMPTAHEVVWDATNAVSTVYTPSRRWQDGVVHVATYSRHVNLGFNGGATLPDPLQVLAGTGTAIRHVTFRSSEDVAAPWIDGYLDAALAGAGLGRDMGDGGTTVRVSAGSKRRPAG